MKPFLGIDVSENNDNELLNGEVFIYTKASEEKLEQLRKANADFEVYKERASLPLAVRIINYVLGFVTALFVIAIFRAFTESAGSLTLSEAYNNAPYLFWITAAVAILFAAISAVAYVKKNRVLGSEEARAAAIKAAMANEEARAELSLPENAPVIDVLTFKYKEKNGKIIPKQTSITGSPYFALEMCTYTADGALRLADCEQVWEFKLDELTGITRVNKTIVISNRGKEIIKQYHDKLIDFKMHTDNSGLINLKPYYVLNISRDGEDYGIYLPPYSLPAIEALTGLSVNPAPDSNDENEEESNDSDFDMPTA